VNFMTSPSWQTWSSWKSGILYERAVPSAEAVYGIGKNKAVRNARKLILKHDHDRTSSVRSYTAIITGLWALQTQI
jgi:hypothetical protein